MTRRQSSPAGGKRIEHLWCRRVNHRNIDDAHWSGLGIPCNQLFRHESIRIRRDTFQYCHCGYFAFFVYLHAVKPILRLWHFWNSQH